MKLDEIEKKLNQLIKTREEGLDFFEKNAQKIKDKKEELKDKIKENKKLKKFQEVIELKKELLDLDKQLDLNDEVMQEFNQKSLLSQENTAKFLDEVKKSSKESASALFAELEKKANIKALEEINQKSLQLIERVYDLNNSIKRMSKNKDLIYPSEYRGVTPDYYIEKFLCDGELKTDIEEAKKAI
ncbi:hypothetical protein [Aerococcus christensenii]|uniref:hypothetical protein n=1 Tax=Aerococcus christensenii TaxID=87541 RepID=UPI000762E814|nr:hypothetical protein [Aerococcus christensenii]AMB92992.1 hypothetical protein AWM71_06765 [Aerococcus christensenii]